MRTLSFLLAGLLSASPPPGAAGSGEASPASTLSAEALYEAGERAYWLGDFDRAIEKFEAAYDASKLPAILYNVGLAHMRRYELSSDRKDLLRARAVLRNYSIELEKDPTLGQADNVPKLLAQIEDQLAASPPTSPQPQPPPATSATLGSSPPPPDPVPPSSPHTRLKVGLGVTGGLAGVSLIVAAATSVTIARQPFQGSRYRAIYEAAERNGVPHGPDDDMCALGRDVAAVAEACGQRDRMRTASLAMLAVTGILGATAIALGILHARRARATRVALILDPNTALLGARGRF